MGVCVGSTVYIQLFINNLLRMVRMYTRMPLKEIGMSACTVHRCCSKYSLFSSLYCECLLRSVRIQCHVCPQSTLFVGVINNRL